MTQQKKDPWYDLPARLLMLVLAVGSAIYIGYTVDLFTALLLALPLLVIGHVILNICGVHTDAAKFGKALIGR